MTTNELPFSNLISFALMRRCIQPLASFQKSFTYQKLTNPLMSSAAWGRKAPFSTTVFPLKNKEIKKKSIPRVQEGHQQELDFEQIQLIFKAWLFRHSRGGYSKGVSALFLH